MVGQSQCKSPVSASSESSFSFPSAKPVVLAVIPKLMVLASIPSRSTKHYREWVSADVLKHVSKVKPLEVDRLVAKGAWVDLSSANDFIMQAPFDDERVCHAALEDEDDFIFMYETVFEDLGVSMPFDFFYAEILQTLGIPPSQLHPNSWAVLKAFETVSLAVMHRMNLFRPYLESYKGFKTHYIKIVPIKGASLTMDGKPIPWYWHIPNQVQGLSLEDLSVGDQVSWGIVNRLPRSVNCKEVVADSFADNRTPFFIAIFKKAGYNLGALIQRSQEIARSAPIEQADVPASPLPSSRTLVVQQGSVLKPIPASPLSPGLKRKGASSPRQDDIKRAKKTDIAPTVVLSSKVEAAFKGVSPMPTDQGVLLLLPLRTLLLHRVPSLPVQYHAPPAKGILILL
ncbi:hypothetical protein CR513_14005, partial [Mucuna pruriens]